MVRTCRSSHPSRVLVGPLLAYLDVLQREEPSRPVLVVLSEFVPRHWWENLLHNWTAAPEAPTTFAAEHHRRRRALITWAS